MKTIFSILLLATLVSCDVGYDAAVEVRPLPPELEITNHMDDPVFFYAVEDDTASKIRLPNPCEDFQPNLPSNTTITLPYEDIMGFDEDAQFVYFLWTNCNGANDSDTYALYY